MGYEWLPLTVTPIVIRTIFEEVNELMGYNDEMVREAMETGMTQVKAAKKLDCSLSLIRLRALEGHIQFTNQHREGRRLLATGIAKAFLRHGIPVRVGVAVTRTAKENEVSERTVLRYLEGMSLIESKSSKMKRRAEIIRGLREKTLLLNADIARLLKLDQSTVWRTLQPKRDRGKAEKK